MKTRELTRTRKCPVAQQAISEKGDSLLVRVPAHLQVLFRRLTVVSTQRWEKQRLYFKFALNSKKIVLSGCSRTDEARIYESGFQSSNQQFTLRPWTSLAVSSIYKAEIWLHDFKVYYEQAFKYYCECTTQTSNCEVTNHVENVQEFQNLRIHLNQKSTCS